MKNKLYLICGLIILLLGLAVVSAKVPPILGHKIDKDKIKEYSILEKNIWPDNLENIYIRNSEIIGFGRNIFGNFIVSFKTDDLGIINKYYIDPTYQVYFDENTMLLAGDGYLKSIDLNNWNQQWENKSNTDKNIMHYLALSKKYIQVDWGNSIIIIDRETGKELGNIQKTATMSENMKLFTPYSSPDLDLDFNDWNYAYINGGKTIFYLVNNKLIVADTEYAYSFDVYDYSNGNFLWESGEKTTLISRLAFDDDNIIGINLNGKIVRLSLKTGEENIVANFMDNNFTEDAKTQRNNLLSESIDQKEFAIYAGDTHQLFLIKKK